MSESWPDQIARLRLMAAGDGDWDLSPNDRAAIQAALDKLAETSPEAAMPWGDVEDGWSERIKAAFPTRSGSHEHYATAMKMVGHRHSKGELVALVNWLLVDREALRRAR